MSLTVGQSSHRAAYEGEHMIGSMVSDEGQSQPGSAFMEGLLIGSSVSDRGRGIPGIDPIQDVSQLLLGILVFSP